jgi:hypothetical protein
VSPVMSACALHVLFRPAEDAPRATRTQPGGQIISETRTPNMAQNLPTLSGFGCGDRQVSNGRPYRNRSVRELDATPAFAHLTNDA